MRLAALFSDGMVLQRDCPIPVWGWAKPGETVSVALADNSASAVADASGRWQATLPAMPAGGPHTLVARGAKTLRAENVLVGEVWVCSGQSNMEFSLEMSRDAKAAIAAADLPRMRLFTVPKLVASTPVKDVEARWEVCTPGSAGGFSGVAYFFGEELHRRLNVPVGLIHTSWGGTPAEAWTSLEGLKAEPELSGYAEQFKHLLNVSAEDARAQYAAARAEFLRKLPQDAGNRGLAEGWAAPTCDDSQWNAMAVPQYWASAGHLTNGVFWFRLAVDVPTKWAGRELLLELGSIDKSDDTYFNGARVGGMTWTENADSWHTARKYAVPGALVKAGRNVIAVRVMSNFTGGGLAGPGSLMRLSLDELGAKPISLAGMWCYKIEQDFGRVTGIAEPASPRSQQAATYLYNGMLAPLIPYALRGAIWYQGESNANDAARYHALFPAMIRDWRRRWGLGDFPFYFVQLANYAQCPVTNESDDSRWAELREAQTATRARLPNIGMAVAIDIGEPNDIHPKNKKDVGVRLALNALTQIHGLKAQHRGPCFNSFKAESAALRLKFDHAEGLAAHDGAARGFAVAGKDRVFHAAEARIEDNMVVVSSPKVAVPVAARYGWADCPVCTLHNAAGLPAEPFRTDDWPVGPEKGNSKRKV